MEGKEQVDLGAERVLKNRQNKNCKICIDKEKTKRNFLFQLANNLFANVKGFE